VSLPPLLSHVSSWRCTMLSEIAAFTHYRPSPTVVRRAKEKLIIVAYMDARGHGAFAGLLEGKGERRTEARFADRAGGNLRLDRSSLVVHGTTAEDSSLIARAANVDLLCLRICLQTSTARCRTGFPRCVRLFSLPFVGTAAGLACVAAVCLPDTLSCVRRCL
jgi:hypothetical protein